MKQKRPEPESPKRFTLYEAYQILTRSNDPTAVKVFREHFPGYKDDEIVKFLQSEFDRGNLVFGNGIIRPTPYGYALYEDERSRRKDIRRNFALGLLGTIFGGLAFVWQVIEFFLKLGLEG